MLLVKLAQSLEQHGVKYALVGGSAVALHGAVRGTLDIDIAIALDENNFIQTEKALKSLGFESRIPVTAKLVYANRLEYLNERNMIAWSFFNPAKPSEIIDVMINEDAAVMNHKTVVISKQAVHVASVEDLIKMKERTGRPQDLEDVRALRKLITQ